jgi:hypothetical protein
MTKTQAVVLQVKWKQQDPLPLCDHPIQELGGLALNDDGVQMGTYYCRECGEASVHTHKSPAFTPLID